MAGYEFHVVMGIVAIVAIVVCVYEHYKEAEAETGETSVSTYTVGATEKCPKCGGTLGLNDGIYQDGKFKYYQMNYSCKACGFEYKSNTLYSGLYPEMIIPEDQKMYESWSRLTDMWNKYLLEYKKGEK